MVIIKLAVLVFFQTWNNFLLPLVYLQGSENQMLASGLYLFAGGRTAEYELAAAGKIGAAEWARMVGDGDLRGV
jgi:ABC-type glycerol-3-phosphate transport system permease component